MTVGVDDELRIREYPGDDTATPRAYGFKILDPDDLRVTRTNADGSETVLVRGTDYSVSGAGNPTGGNVTPLAPIATGTSWRIEGDMSLGQPTDYTAGDDFPAESHERGLDRSMIAHQEARRDLNDTITRALMVPRGEVSPTLPPAAQRAGKFGAYDADGRPIAAEGTGNDPALRTELAQDDGLTRLGSPGFPTAREEMDAKGPVATKSSAAGATLYPVDMRLGADAQPHPFEYITNNAVRNAIRAGTSTTDVSGELQAMLDDWRPDIGKAGIIDFPIGRYALAEPLQFPNWVGWRGFGRGTQFFALPGHSGPYMFQFDSDPLKAIGSPEAYFNSFLQGFDINANAQAAIDWIIYAPSWNEKCGLRDVMARQVENGFLFIDEWHGGSSGFVMDNLEVFTTANAHSNSKTVIRLRGKTRAGALIGNRPIVTMSGVTIAGATAGVDGAGAGLTMIEVDNVDLDVKGSMHFERALQGILVKNGGNLRGGTLSGSDAGGRVVDLVVRDSDHTGQIDIDLSMGTGTTRALHDYKVGAPGNTVITAPIGGRLTIPARPGQAIAEGVFEISGAAIASSTLRGCSGVTRSSAGYYQVTLADNFPAGSNNDNYHVVAEAHDDIACYAHARRSERTAGTFFIRVQGQSNDSLADPTQVSFRVYRKPGL